MLLINLSKDINNIKMYNIQLLNPLDVVQNIYDMRAKFKEKIYLERIEKKKHKKNRKKGVKDPTYKGTINIVRG